MNEHLKEAVELSIRLKKLCKNPAIAGILCNQFWNADNYSMNDNELTTLATRTPNEWMNINASLFISDVTVKYNSSDDTFQFKNTQIKGL